MKFLQVARNYKIIEEGASIVPHIPNGIYNIECHPITKELYLTKTEDDKFTLPNKLYGNVESLGERVINAFGRSYKNMGVLLNGVKGTGKSLTAKYVCNNVELPILLLKELPEGSDIITFLSSFKQEVVVFIDEFEKVMDKGDQITLLSLFDGITNNKILFLLTSNETNELNTNLFNRPSRIKYLLNFGMMSKEEIDIIVSDALENKEHEENLKKLVQILAGVTQDTLISIIEEVNALNKCDINDLLTTLNIQPFDMSFVIRVEGVLENDIEYYAETTTDQNPLTSSIWMATFAIDKSTGEFVKLYYSSDNHKPVDERRSYKKEVNFEYELEDYDKVELVGDSGFNILTKDGTLIQVTQKPKKAYTYAY